MSSISLLEGPWISPTFSFSLFRFRKSQYKTLRSRVRLLFLNRTNASGRLRLSPKWKANSNRSISFIPFQRRPQKEALFFLHFRASCGAADGSFHCRLPFFSTFLYVRCPTICGSNDFKREKLYSSFQLTHSFRV